MRWHASLIVEWAASTIKGDILPSEDIEYLFMKLPSFTQIDEMA
jgi:hypothetical protein